MPDSVVHFELPTTDLDRAQRFYRDTFGWQLRSEAGHGYVLASTTTTDAQGRPLGPGAINGGLLRRQAPIESIVLTIKVADIDAALKKVEQAGGAVVRTKQPVGAVGFAAYFKDPEGNVLGLWQDAAK